MDVAVGKPLSRNITSGEQVDGELDRFIEKRHEKRVAEEGERAAEDERKAAEAEAARNAPRVEFFGGTPAPRRQVGSRIS